MTSPPSTTPSTSTSSSNLHKKLPSVDTSSIASSSATPAPSATPSSTTSTSSSLTNNPYLALATNYQRGPSASPTGHPLMVPYPFFYPSPATPITPGTPTAYVPYNPYYYMAAPVPNGMYAAPQGFIPPPQPAPQPQQQQPKQAPSDQRAVKPKRLKSHTVTSKSFSIPMVPRDKQGKPMLPLNVGIMTVISLGNVCMREHFHTERYIFPVGYEVTRRYLSTVDPSVEVVYHCTILDGGDGPKFQIIPSDRPDQPVIAGTATGAWSNIVKQANAIRNRQHSNSVSGPDFFGLGQNTIKHLIQELPNADKLRDYVWQNFVEGGPLGGRHAAVIPALPEEYDASMPIGPYYPRRNIPVPEANLPRGLSYYPQHIIAQADAQRGGQDGPVAGPSSISAPPMAPLPSESDIEQAAAQQTLVSAINAAVGDPTQLAFFGLQPQLAHSISAPPVAPSQQTQQTQKRVTRSSAAAANTSTSVPSSSTVPNSNTRHTRSTSKVQQHIETVQPQQVPEANVSPPTVNEDDATQMTFAGPPPAASNSAGS
ncbi:F/Y rich C-terminus-domain-containing protein [Crepidotus variabilis]|uniref:F/Y rich C-terminus-domain-containing protein n=1 Tax=Crepidotus variabilis TaxID=179855 RepID=A0A9P6JL11_9AGAR|nr:F/Y rich C-terminus-domain-containing protein [Crepidotus variabilis]